MSTLLQSTLIAILVAGTTCGVLDLTFALVVFQTKGVSPVRALQGIASAALGPAAFEQGIQAAFLGVLFHFVVAFSAAAAYCLAATRLRSGWTVVRYSGPSVHDLLRLAAFANQPALCDRVLHRPTGRPHVRSRTSHRAGRSIPTVDRNAPSIPHHEIVRALIETLGFRHSESSKTSMQYCRMARRCLGTFRHQIWSRQAQSSLDK
jgi:hypothetical protein